MRRSQNELGQPMPTPRIVIHVAPRLLSDVLCVVLRERGLVVEQLTDNALPRPRVSATRFDVAVVTAEFSGDVMADTVLVIDTSNSLPVTDVGRTVSLAGPGSLDDFLATIDGIVRAT